MNNAEINMAKAREVIRDKAPYMVPLLYGLVPHASTDIPTMATSPKMVLLYNPTWVSKLSFKVLAGVLMHECSHVFRDHLNRLDVDDKETANIAMDIALNPDLIEAGWELTPGALFPKDFKLPNGQTAEWYFEELKKQSRKQQSKGKGKGDSSDPQVCAGCCGGTAGNSPNADAEQEADGFEDQGRSDLDKQRIIKSTAEAIKSFAKQQGRGSMPNYLREMAELALESPKVNWRQKLAQVIRRATGNIRAGGSDFSLKRPSKRSFTRGIMRPGLIQQMPEVCIIRDTSGSMGQEQINDAITESLGIVRATGIESLWFMDADARVASQKRVRVSQFKATLVEVNGRGGTNFEPAVRACEKLKPKPDITIYITDGDGYAGPIAPAGMEFIWCVVPSYYKARPAKWGHLITIGEEVELTDPE